MYAKHADGDSQILLPVEMDYCSPKRIVASDWEDNMNSVWDYTFNEIMKVDPKQCKVMLNEPPLTPLKKREKIVEVMY